VELVDGDWNDTAAIERALKGVDGAFVMLPAVWAPSPDFKEAKGVIANYVEALTKAAPPRVVGLSRASNVEGMVRPSTFAVFRLMMRSNSTGCSIGRSPGLVPRKMILTT
jgi:uncharacterized protein YbjT (DUF2867 family)